MAAKTKSSSETVRSNTFNLASLRLRFAERGGQLRVQSIMPAGAKTPADVSGGALWERTPVLVHVRGRERMGHAGARAINTQPSLALKLRRIRMQGSASAGTVVAELFDELSGLQVTLRYQAFGSAGAMRVTAEARNGGTKPITLEQFMIMLPGLGRADNTNWGETFRIHYAHNTWFGEAQWTSALPSHLGIADARPPFGDTLGAAVWRQIGTWNTSDHLQMGVLSDSDTGVSWAWQIEQSGSWQMEVARVGGAFYLAGGGPSARHGDWFVTLKPGESVSAAPLAFGAATGGFEEAIGVLQQYRRAACRPESKPDEHLPVFFNDYMNCLKGNPNLDNTLPMIDAAAAAGAEYYVIDAGWFEPSDKSWGSGLGDWQESPDRFGQMGLRGVCDYIRGKGMIPGLWAEIECVSKTAKVFSKPDSWFICANGQRIYVGGRYFFNFANPQVRAYCHKVLDRLRRDYGIGYLKLDYNADAGIGDNQKTDSLGAGQVANTRGFYQWLEELHARHPDLIVENCGSGGMRFDYGLLSRTQVQSTSDQEDYKRYPSIMAGVLAAGLPEQMAIWSYPQPTFDDEAICLNLVTPMLCRWHLSGRIDQMSPQQLARVGAATEVWKKQVRRHIPKMLPFWPTPMRHLYEQRSWLAAGLRDLRRRRALISVFRLGSPDASISLPLEQMALSGKRARILFPTDLGGSAQLRGRELVVKLPKEYSARLIEIA